MRRVLAALALLVASCATALIASSGARAVHPTFDITLNPIAPNPATPLGISGHCDNADATAKPIHLQLIFVVTNNVVGEVDPVVDDTGNYSGTFPADWAPYAGFFQVVGNCPLQSIAGGYQASPVFSAPLGLDTEPMTVQTGSDDPNKPLEMTVDVAGAGCIDQYVYWTVLDGSLASLTSGIVQTDADGTWSAHQVVTLDAPADDARIGYGVCAGSAENTALYSTEPPVNPPDTEPTTSTPSTTPTTATPTTTAPATAAPAAPAVNANPTYTG